MDIKQNSPAENKIVSVIIPCYKQVGFLMYPRSVFDNYTEFNPNTGGSAD